MILTDGILRLRYRTSTRAPELTVEGVHEVSIDMWATANVFGAGHRIRVEIAGSNFPKYGRNSNTGGPISTEGADQHQPARIDLLHDPDHPSRLVLPVQEARRTRH
jgi:putative CocE/NonD family hydrolase